MDKDLGSRTLRVAASLVGGPRRLAQHLGASPAHMLAWLSGTTAAPRDVVLKALAVILKDLEDREP